MADKKVVIISPPNVASILSIQQMDELRNIVDKLLQAGVELKLEYYKISNSVANLSASTC
jgi:hypothetical protein